MKIKIINNSKRKGFTLIEIMVAVAIMLVLMGFLVPKLAGYRAKAMEAKAINTGKQIYSAAMTSYSMTNGKFDSVDVPLVVTNTTGVEGLTTSGASDNGITIGFKSDALNYTVIIDASNNTYEIKDKDGKQLFAYGTTAVATTP